MEKRRQILGIVNKFVNYIDKLSDEEIDQIESKEATIKFEFITNSGSIRPKSRVMKKTELNNIDIDSLINSLNEISSRQEGETFLQNRCPNRIQMEKVARKLDIPFQKKDNTEHLRNKIIEGTIGYRLRSQAIQTTTNIDYK